MKKKTTKKKKPKKASKPKVEPTISDESALDLLRESNRFDDDIKEQMSNWPTYADDDDDDDDEWVEDPWNPARWDNHEDEDDEDDYL